MVAVRERKREEGREGKFDVNWLFFFQFVLLCLFIFNLFYFLCYLILGEIKLYRREKVKIPSKTWVRP